MVVHGARMCRCKGLSGDADILQGVVGDESTVHLSGDVAALQSVFGDVGIVRLSGGGDTLQGVFGDVRNVLLGDVDAIPSASFTFCPHLPPALLACILASCLPLLPSESKLVISGHDNEERQSINPAAILSTAASVLSVIMYIALSKAEHSTLSLFKKRGMSCEPASVLLNLSPPSAWNLWKKPTASEKQACQAARTSSSTRFLLVASSLSALLLAPVEPSQSAKSTSSVRKPSA